jgi:hypothetical protein
MLLAVVLALSAIGAVSASASATAITSSGSPYSGAIAGNGNAHVWWGYGTLSCSSSNLGGTITSSGSGSITSWTAGGCLDSAGNAFTVSYQNLPYSYNVSHTSGNDGNLNITSPVSVKITRGVTSCTFTSTAGAIDAAVDGGAPARVNLLDSMGGGSFFCGVSMTWSNDITLTTPGNLHVGP